MSELFEKSQNHFLQKNAMIIEKFSDNSQGNIWGMVYKKYECKAHTYQEKTIKKKGKNQRIQKKGKSFKGRLSLEFLEVPNVLEQA